MVSYYEQISELKRTFGSQAAAGILGGYYPSFGSFLEKLVEGQGGETSTVRAAIKNKFGEAIQNNPDLLDKIERQMAADKTLEPKLLKALREKPDQLNEKMGEITGNPERMGTIIDGILTAPAQPAVVAKAEPAPVPSPAPKAEKPPAVSKKAETPPAAVAKEKPLESAKSSPGKPEKKEAAPSVTTAPSGNPEPGPKEPPSSAKQPQTAAGNDATQRSELILGIVAGVSVIQENPDVQKIMHLARDNSQIEETVEHKIRSETGLSVDIKDLSAGDPNAATAKLTRMLEKKTTDELREINGKVSGWAEKPPPWLSVTAMGLSWGTANAPQATEGILSFITGGSRLGEQFEGIQNQVMADMKAGQTPDWGSMFGGLSGTLSQMGTALQGLMSQFMQYLPTLFASFGQMFSGMMGGLTGAVQSVGNSPDMRNNFLAKNREVTGRGPESVVSYDAKGTRIPDFTRAPDPPKNDPEASKVKWGMDSGPSYTGSV